MFDKIDRIKVVATRRLGARRRRRLPEAAPAVRRDRVLQRPRRQSRTPTTTSRSAACNATWRLEEYGVTYDDDDVKFVGAIDQNGLFTPNLDGPNPARSSSRNNVGDVWVVASYQPPDKDARPLKARAHARRHRSALREVRPVEGAAMMLLRRGEYHSFNGGDAQYLYLVPSAAVVRLDDLSQAVLDGLADGDRRPTISRTR